MTKENIKLIHGKFTHVYVRIAVEIESSSFDELPVKSPVSTSSNTIGILMYPKCETWLYYGNLTMKKNLPHQEYGNDCGIFIVMYFWYLSHGSEFDFSTKDMPQIRNYFKL